MVRRVVVQLQNARHRIEDLFRRVAFAALLEAGVVVDADAREQRYFLSARARNSSLAV